MPYADQTKRNEYNKARRSAPPMPIRYGGTPYVALGFLKMMRRPVGPAELRHLSPRFKDPRATMDKLVEIGYAVYDQYRDATVTELGVSALYELGKRGALSRGSKGTAVDDD